MQSTVDRIDSAHVGTRKRQTHAKGFQMSLENITPETKTYDLVDSTQPPAAQFAEAFAKAQGEFPVIPKDSRVEVKSREGKFLYEYLYADLTTIISHTRPALAKYGIGFTQTYVKDELLGPGIETLFIHKSGYTQESGFVPFEISKALPMKEIAALFTYAKRISLTAALGISADEDVDAAVNEATQGNTTSKTSAKAPASVPVVVPKGVTPENKEPPAKTESSAGSGLVSKDQLARLFAIAAEHKWTKEQLKYFLEIKYQKESTKDLTQKEYSDFVETVQTKSYQAACATMIGSSMPDFS